jgi:hypothetical protein
LATTSAAKWLAIAILASAGAMVAALLLQHAGRAPRGKYVLVNETGNHDFDLAFRMSLKLAERKSGIENALILLPALAPSRTIEETTGEYFSKLRIGERRGGRGILYLYSAKENLLRIEVSYALEGDIPDAYCRRLEEAARTYMLSEVPQDFISELIITTNLRGMESKGDAQPMARPAWLNAEFLSGGAGAMIQGYVRTLEDYERAISRLPQAQWDEFGPSPSAETTVQRYLLSLERGIGDPRLPLLTPGSRVFRAVVPRDEAQQRRIFEFLRAAAPDRLLYADDLAPAVPQPGKSNLPIVLRKSADGFWYVDEPKAWTYFHRFEDDVNFHVKYDDNPFLEPLRAMHAPNTTRTIFGSHAHTPRRPALALSLAEAVKSLEDHAARDGAAGYAAMGDIYLFEMNWITRAIAAYEKAEALDAGALEYHWRLFDLYLNASRADKMLAELRFLAEHLPDDAQTRALHEFYKKKYAFRD